jgi:FMN reductase
VSSILVLSGSPSATSRTAALTEHLADRLRGQGHAVGTVRVRDLPPAPLLAGNAADPQIAEVLTQLSEVDGVIVASPVYKAAYSGLLKTLLDLLPQFALAGKVVLPVVTGGSPAHVLAIDYALRPVLSSLGANHIVQGWFVLDQHIEWAGDGVQLAAPAAGPLYQVVDDFSAVLLSRHPATV